MSRCPIVQRDGHRERASGVPGTAGVLTTVGIPMRRYGHADRRGGRHLRRPDEDAPGTPAPTRNGPRAARLLDLQARLGNRRVAALVSDPAGVHRAADPDALEAAAARIDAVLDPDALGDEPATAPVQASSRVQRDGPSPDPEPRKGTPGDVVKAILKTPAGKKAVSAVREEAKGVVRSASTGEKAAMVVSGILVGGGALAGVLSDPEARAFLLPKVSGKKIPVPGVDGLSASISFDTEGRPTGGMVYFDVGRYLPPSLGFGPK